MTAPTRKIWWPRALYETRPAACLSLGALLGAVALAIALVAGYWPDYAAGILTVGIVLALYGGITRQLRGEHRRQNPPTDASRR